MARGHSNSGGGRTNGRVEGLTEREIQVLRHTARGLSAKEIATALNVSAKTVESHKAHVMDKLNIHDRVLLARYAIREGLVSA